MAFDHYSIGPQFDLYLLPIEKFKKVTIRLYQMANLEVSPKTAHRAILPYVLKRGCEKFPTFDALQKELERLFGSTLTANVVKAGEWQIIRYSMTAPNEKYLPSHPSIFRPLLETLSEILYRPHLENGHFRTEYVESEKAQMKNYILGMINNKARYAFHRTLQHMCPEEAYREYQYGRLEDIETITPEGLYQFYKREIDSLPLALYVVGDIEVQRWKNWAREVFLPHREGGYTLHPCEFCPPPDEPQTVIEELPQLNQSHLYLGFRTPITYQKGDIYALAFAEALLGGMAHSKFFVKVREEKGLAYRVNSSLGKHKGLYFCYAGIEGEKWEETRDVMLKEIEAVQKGEISDFEMKSTREGIANALRSAKDSPLGWIGFHLSRNLHGREETMEGVLEELQNVDRQRIVEATQTLKLDTIFLLRPAQETN